PMAATQSPATGSMDRISYQDLYRRWEEGNWSATRIDFSRDREGWEALTEVQRHSALWLYSMFFYGEDSVTDNLSPYIDAAPTEEQSYFLATQQVDEARHAVFFHRFFREVIGSGDTIGATLARTEPELNWGYRKVFDRLDRMADELRRDRSLPKFAQAIALYHMIVEAALAQPGQHFIEGMGNVSRDEQRHIAFGAKTLSECFERSDECREAVVEILREVFPWAVAVFVPPGWDLRYTREYGFELEDIFAWGLQSLRGKWRAIGYPLEDMPGVLPVGGGETQRDAAARIIALLRAGALGEPNGRPDSSPETQRLFFEVVSRSVDASGTDGPPLTVQWRFSDARPWHLRVENGATAAREGEEPAADVTIETDWATWVDVATGRTDPARALVRRKLRPRGSPRDLARFSQMTPRMRNGTNKMIGRWTAALRARTSARG
ncbi:MAG TPA: ribonucleotide-diphosphate reductase subunit beta, partial [Thermoleophilaceae bacterium]|nr:ribonucleotide-diphosphate reductase subunit beta [Thermoleophilaceae bacterium]